MDDLGAFQEFVKIIGSGGAGNALLMAALFFLWKLDRRVGVLEVALGVTKIPQVALRDSERGFGRVSTAVAMVVVAAILAGCAGGGSPFSGKLVGLSVQLGGFTVGVSGSFPGEKKNIPAEDPILGVDGPTFGSDGG